MGFSGDLKDLSLADLLQSIQANRHTGTLTIVGQREELDRIYFEQGMINAVGQAEEKTAPFADVTGRMRVVAARDLEKALKKKGRKLLRTQLKNMGLLDEPAYRKAAETYIRDVVYDFFLKPRERFEFKKNNPKRGAF